MIPGSGSPRRFVVRFCSPFMTSAFPTNSWTPATIRLRFNTNATDIWLAVNGDTRPPDAVILPEPQTVLVWRQDLMSRFRPFGPEEAMMWIEAAKGIRFGVLCEMVVSFGGEHEAELRAATYLKNWVDTGMLADVSLNSPQTDRVMGRTH